MLQFYYSAKVGLTCLSFTVSHLMWNALSYDAIHAFVAECIPDKNALPMMPESDTFDLSLNPRHLIPASLSVQVSIGRMTEVSIECPNV